MPESKIRQKEKLSWNVVPTENSSSSIRIFKAEMTIQFVLSLSKGVRHVYHPSGQLLDRGYS